MDKSVGSLAVTCSPAMAPAEADETPDETSGRWDGVRGGHVFGPVRVSNVRGSSCDRVRRGWKAVYRRGTGGLEYGPRGTTPCGIAGCARIATCGGHMYIEGRRRGVVGGADVTMNYILPVRERVVFGAHACHSAACLSRACGRYAGSIMVIWASTATAVRSALRPPYPGPTPCLLELRSTRASRRAGSSSMSATAAVPGGG